MFPIWTFFSSQITDSKNTRTRRPVLHNPREEGVVKCTRRTSINNHLVKSMACRFTIIYELLTSSWSLSQIIDCINPHISGSSGPLQRTGYKSTHWTEMFKYTSHFDPFITVCIEWMDSSTSEWRVHVIWMSLSDTDKQTVMYWHLVDRLDLYSHVNMVNK